MLVMGALLTGCTIRHYCLRMASICNILELFLTSLAAFATATSFQRPQVVVVIVVGVVVLVIAPSFTVSASASFVGLYSFLSRPEASISKAVALGQVMRSMV